MKKFIKKIILFFILLSVFTLASAEKFQVRKLNEVKFSEVTEAVKFKIGVNDAINIELPKDMTYVCGMEINLKIPEEIAAWKDSVSYSLYDNVRKSKSEYIGNRISYATIPGRLSLNIYIPLTDEFNIKDNPYSERIPVTPNIDNKNIFFRLQLVMDNVPDNFEKIQMETTVKPVLIDKGKLNFSIEPVKQLNLPTLASKTSQKSKIKEQKKEASYTAYLDDKPLSEYKSMLLPTGEHHVSIISESYRNELRTFVIDQAKTTNLSVELRSIEPTVIFICPVNTDIYFDEIQIENPKTAFIIEPGEHSIKMVVGDYEIVKKLTAINGRSYSISLDIDASIFEEK